MFRKKFAIIMALLVVLFINAFLVTQMKFLNDNNFVQRYILVSSNSSLIQKGIAAKLGTLKDTLLAAAAPVRANQSAALESTTEPISLTHHSSVVDKKKSEGTIKKLWNMNGQFKLRYAAKPSLPAFCNITGLRAANTADASLHHILVFFQLPAENFTERADLRSELSAIENVKVFFIAHEHEHANRTIRNDLKFESKRFKDLLIIIDHDAGASKSPAVARLAAAEWTITNCKHADFVIMIDYVNRGDLADLKKVIADNVYANMNFQCLLTEPVRAELEEDVKSNSTLADPTEHMREEVAQDLTKSFIVCDESNFIVSSNHAIEGYYNFLHKSI